MRTRPLALVLLGLALAPVVHAAEPSTPAASGPPAATAHRDPGFADRFFRGTSAGRLPVEKALLVGGFYAGSLTSVGFGIASFLRAGAQGDDADAFKLTQPAGFCADLADPACARYRGLLTDERNSRTRGVALLGLGGLLAIGGALTAELWHNDASVPQLALSFDPTSVFVGATANF